MTLPEPDVTRLLEEARLGGSEAADRLARAVYDTLHRIAVGALRRERAGHTLQPTELVDEAFVRLVNHKDTSWESRSHFYGVAANVTRRILVDHARKRARVKRNHGVQVTLDDAVVPQDASGADGWTWSSETRGDLSLRGRWCTKAIAANTSVLRVRVTCASSDAGATPTLTQ